MSMASAARTPLEVPQSREVRERPLLMSGPMVRATLEDRKTMTRRVVKGDYGLDREKVALEARKAQVACECPYGNVGDRLWVREAWGLVTMHELGQYVYGGRPIPPRDEVVYRAGKRMGTPIPNTRPMQFETEWKDDLTPARWRPSIHMPRWASRLTLEITEIRVERLQEISTADILAEGALYAHQLEHPHVSDLDRRVLESPALTKTRDAVLRRIWRNLWDSLNAKREGGAFSWDRNPFVWCIGFRTRGVASEVLAERATENDSPRATP